MAGRKKHGHSGGHGWFVTFADLMGLLLSYFVMLVAFSTQDKAQMMAMMGSIREAFGNQKEVRQSGMIELDGLPTRTRTQNVEPQSREMAETVGPLSEAEAKGRTPTRGGHEFASAAATLRQALEDMPEIAELSRNIVLRQTPEGVALSLVDADGRSMFPEGSPYPYDRARYLLSRISEALRRLPNQIQILGHTSSAADTMGGGTSPWDLSAARANATRRLLEELGLGRERFHSVIGKADSEPLFPDDPLMAANRRVELLVMPEVPPLPAGLKP